METLIDVKKTELKELLEMHLKRSDKSNVARKHKVHRSQITRVLKVMNIESPILKSLIAKAEANKAKGLEQSEIIEQQIDKLK